MKIEQKKSKILTIARVLEQRKGLEKLKTVYGWHVSRTNIKE